MEARHQERFDRDSKTSLAFYNRANDLRASALVLWHALSDDTPKLSPQALGLGEGFSFEIALPGVFSMLAGLSIELLAKAALVAQESAPLRNHNLPALLGRLDGLVLSDDETAIIALMRKDIEWGGRYPVPKKAEQLDSYYEAVEATHEEKTLGNVVTRTLNPERAVSKDNYNKIWNKIDALYWETREPTS